MYNPFLTSTISLRARGLLSFPFDDYSHCSNERHPFVYSSPRTCCSCCGNSMYKAPITPSYCCNLYGWRQSSLIQCSPHRKLIPGGFDRCYYARLPACNVDKSCYCERVSNFRDKNVGVRKGGLRRCMVFEERSEMYDIGGFNEAEAMLSLLTEDVDEECFRVTKEMKSMLKKPSVGKRDNGGFSYNFEIMKKRVDLDEKDEHRCECGSTVISKKKDNRRREEIIRREEEKETLLREENTKRMLLEERRTRRKEEREALLRKESQKSEEKRERESMLRRENWKVSSRAEERKDLLRREDRQKVRRDGSSSSSYYSVSSNGDYASDTEIELKKGKFLGESSSGHKRVSRINEINYEDTKKEENVVNLTKNSVVESDFRKKSEKKLADISVVDMESRKESSSKESKLSMTNESNYEKSSDYYVSYDDKKVKSTGSTKFNEERRQQELRQTSDDFSRQPETRLKYKHFTEMQDARIDDGISYGSQKVYSGNSSQETLGEHRKAVGLGSKEDEYQRNSLKAAQISGIQGTNITNTSISQQSTETNVKEEKNYSNNIQISINEAPKQQQQQSGQVSGLVESSGTSQEWARKKGKLILRTESDKLMKQEEYVNLAYGSSSESNLSRTQTHARIIESDIPEKQYNDSTKISISQSGDSGATVEEKNKAKSETLVRHPSLGSTVEITTKPNRLDGQPSTITSREDTIGSASRLQESSALYVGEFVHQVTSEIEKEKKTDETKSVKGPDSQQSVTKGPSDEMWNVEEPSVQELSKAENQDNSRKANNAVAVRTGRSLWNVISDVVHLRWSHNSESHSSGRRTVGRSSSHQSTSSEAWFSGHEAEENEEAKERQSIAQEEKVPKKVEEGASSSTVGINVPSSSVAISSSPSASSAALIDSSIPSPALRLQRSPAIHGASSEAGEAVEQPESAGRKLQRKDQVSRDRFDEWEEAYRLEADQRQTDEMFMREALLEAQKAADSWEVPVGAVLVHNGKIIARGCNLVEELRDSTAHAEMICIREASNLLKSWRLSGTTLYVTLEPCPMCAGAILQARIDAVVWGAPNKLLGADGSWIRLFPNNDGGNALEQTDKPAAPIHPFHPKIIIRRGVLTAECAEAMQQFFQLRRKKEKKPESASTSISAPTSDPASASASPSATATAAHSRLPIPHRHPKFSARLMHFFFCL